MALPFSEYFEKISPTWLIGETVSAAHYGQRFVFGAVGLMSDMALEAARLAVRAAYLTSPDLSPEALPFVSAERNIFRVSPDTDATFAARLQDAWALFEFVGNESVIIGELERLPAITTIEIKIAADWPLVPPAPHWSQFWLISRAGDHSVTAVETWGGGGTYATTTPPVWGAGASADFAASLRRRVRTYKAGHEVCRRAIFIETGNIFDEAPDASTYNDGLTYGEGVGFLDC